MKKKNSKNKADLTAEVRKRKRSVATKSKKTRLAEDEKQYTGKGLFWYRLSHWHPDF